MMKATFSGSEMGLKNALGLTMSLSSGRRQLWKHTPRPVVAQQQRFRRQRQMDIRATIKFDNRRDSAERGTPLLIGKIARP